MSGEPLLRIEDLRVEFGPADAPLVAVKGAGLSVAAGEIVGLIGESGSGKSLTCRSVMRLVPRPGRIATGRIAFDGRDVLGLDQRALRAFRAHDAGLVSQDPFSSLNPVFRVGDQLAETLRCNAGLGRRAAAGRAVELLEEVGIPEPTRRALAYPHELSGGMRQRVMIALATASRPRLLLADEPTTALDVTTQAQILALLKRLRDEHGMAVLLVSHDFGVIAEVCDRVVVMYGGHVVESGPLAAIATTPRHPYTRALLESVPSLASAGRAVRRAGIPGSPPELTDVLAGCVFRPRCAFAREGCEAISMRPEHVGPGHLSACPVHPFGMSGPVALSSEGSGR